MICPVWVEDYLTIDISEKQISLYKQGEQINEVFSAVLSEGTSKRLARNGQKPQWELERISGTNTDVSSLVSADGNSFIVNSMHLLSGGSDQYRVICKAGNETKSFEFTINVLDLKNMAESITAVTSRVNADA